MINCLFCDAHHCEWWGVDRWVDSCPYIPEIEDEDEDEQNNMREYEDEQAELFMAEERAITAVYGREVPNDQT